MFMLYDMIIGESLNILISVMQFKLTIVTVNIMNI